MKKILILLMITVLSMLFYQCGNKDKSKALENSEMNDLSQSLIKKQKTINGKDKFCYVDSKGKTIIPYGKYDFTYSDTINSIGFVVKKKKGIVAINNQGEELFKVFAIDNGPDYPVNNIFRIIDKDKMGFANMNGDIILKPKYDFILPFSDGYAAFNIGGRKQKIPDSDYSEFIGGKWGLLDQNGNIVIAATYDDEEDLFYDPIIEESKNNKMNEEKDKAWKEAREYNKTITDTTFLQIRETMSQSAIDPLKNDGSGVNKDYSFNQRVYLAALERAKKHLTVKDNQFIFNAKSGVEINISEDLYRFIADVLFVNWNTWIKEGRFKIIKTEEGYYDIRPIDERD